MKQVVMGATAVVTALSIGTRGEGGLFVFPVLPSWCGRWHSGIGVLPLPVLCCWWLRCALCAVIGSPQQCSAIFGVVPCCGHAGTMDPLPCYTTHTTENWAVVQTLSDATGYILSVSWNAAGTRLAAGGYDTKVRVYETGSDGCCHCSGHSMLCAKGCQHVAPINQQPTPFQYIAACESLPSSMQAPPCIMYWGIVDCMVRSPLHGGKPRASGQDMHAVAGGAGAMQNGDGLGVGTSFAGRWCEDTVPDDGSWHG